MDDVADADVNPFFVDNSPALQQPNSLPRSEMEGNVDKNGDVDSDSGSSSSSSKSAIIDKRQKIARRMLPAAMLRRLEREAEEKQRQKELRKRREARGTETPRPGRAVVRRAQANGDVHDFVNLIASQGESSESDATPALPSPPPLRQRELIIISDDDMASDAASQAHEDNGGAQSLARLYDGDFETIIAGKRPSARRKDGAARNRKDRTTAHRRPALGLVKRARGSANTTPRAMYQTRLDFPAADESPIRRTPTSKKRKKQASSARLSRKAGPKERPAIRLDDDVIFSNADFAFEDEELVPSATQPRLFRRTVSKSTLPTETVDAGVGKAKSWANFDKFPVDFDITPLPSGLYCSPKTYVGSGRLKGLVQFLRTETPSNVTVNPVTAYGVELRVDMSPAAINSVVKVLFDGIRDAVTAFANETSTESPDLAPFTFLGEYMSARRTDADGDAVSLRSATTEAILSLSQNLDDFHLGTGNSSRPAREVLIAVRISLLDLACRDGLSPGSTSIASSDLVSICSVAILKQLLSAGFDKAIRPLKRILRGESESPEVDDHETIAWIAVGHILEAWCGASTASTSTHGFAPCLEKALNDVYHHEDTGPIAAERIWFLIFGLCALSQFEADGRTIAVFTPVPRWSLVRRAVGLIKISHNEETEEKAHVEQLRGRDRYIKVMMERCVRLSATWKWNFDRESFSVATKDLGVIFKNRQYRNLPTEQPVDYPEFVTQFDISLTAAEDTRHETAFELYLRLVCVAASDLISRAESLQEAQQAERDVQRLIMSIIPVSPVKFNRVFPPTPRQIGQLINRYSTMIASCYFSPSLLPWLLANSRKWISFETADFESRQVCIRGLMYLAVACRHHNASLDPVVDQLASILTVLQGELDKAGKASAPAQAPSRKEIERTMVLVVACFRQIIQRHSFDPEAQAKPAYPDPCLLHKSEPR